ncbi:MAG: S41 family peptidase [Bdellovibrionales bacterium]
MAAITLIFCATASASTAKPKANSPALTCQDIPAVMAVFLSKHIEFDHLTPELEKRTKEEFLKRLDGSKFYLLESDYRFISKGIGEIFKKVSEKNCTAITNANSLMKIRVSERIKFAVQYLGPDFKIDPKLILETDPAKRQRPTNLAKANQEFAIQLQSEVANYIGSGIGLDRAKRLILKNYDRQLKHTKKQTGKDALSTFLDSFAVSLDPHSNYMPPEVNEDFKIQMSLSLEGIGASLSFRNGFTTVEELLPGGAALSSGLVKKKDKIIAVAQGESEPFTDVLEMELREVISLIRGPKDTKVRLKILRREKKEVSTVEVTLTRAKITLEDQAAFSTYFDRKIHGKPVKIAFINLPSFYYSQEQGGRNATGDLRRLLIEAREKKANVVLLDLSINGGGSLQDAVDVVGLFITKGSVVRVGGRGAIVNGGDPRAYQTLDDEDPSVVWPGPLVVFTSRVSASASEIVSGALKDYRRALIIGADHTFGKGTVQTLDQLPTGLGAAKVTLGTFFTPGGFSTQYRGVTADIAFPSPFGTEAGESSLPYSLPARMVPPFLSQQARLAYGPDAWVPVAESLVKKLGPQSLKRVAGSKDFRKMAEELKKFKDRSTKITIGDLLKGHDPSAKDAKPEDEDADTPTLSREERIKKYLERPDVKEALNTATDYAAQLFVE